MNEYIIIIDGNTKTYDFNQLKEIGLKEYDLVCKVGTEDWKQAREFEEFNEMLFPKPTVLSTPQKKTSKSEPTTSIEAAKPTTEKPPVVNTSKSEPTITIDFPKPIFEKPPIENTSDGHSDNVLTKTNTSPKKTPLFLVIAGALAILLIIGTVWFFFMREVPRKEKNPQIESIKKVEPKEEVTDEKKIGIPPVSEELKAPCNKFEALISEGEKLMKITNIKEKQAALTFFLEAKKMLKDECNTAENIEILKQKKEIYVKDSVSLKDQYMKLSMDFKKSKDGELIKRRIEYFDEAAKILTYP